MMEAQLDTGATHDTRIFTGCWAFAGNAPDSANAIDASRKVLNLRIHSLRYLGLVAKA
jgi:hypothetical protein